MTQPKGITRIQIEGFRSLKSVELRPGRVTVLIGPNGSGKSNLLSALHLLSKMYTRSLRVQVGLAGGASSLLHYGPKVTSEIRFAIEFEGDSGPGRYSANLLPTSEEALVFADERAELLDPEGEAQSCAHDQGHAESRLYEMARGIQRPIAAPAAWWLSQLSMYHFHDTSVNSPLRLNSRQAEDLALLPEGGNLAAYLRRLRGLDHQDARAAWGMIVGLLQQVAPFVKDLDPDLVAPSMAERSAVRLRWMDERDHRFDVAAFSDGTLRALALITALAQPSFERPQFIMIDEPELGLHPAAIHVFAELVRSASHDSQILLATQSPALLDEFEADEVVVTERAGGETSLSRLDPADLADWLERYTLSELYDKNVLRGRP